MSFLSHRARSASSDIDRYHGDPPESDDSSAVGGLPSDANDGDKRAYADASTDKAKEARKKVSHQPSRERDLM
jgi:hypothetical protein